MDVKPGIKTTEFWFGVIGVVAELIVAGLSLAKGHPYVAAILAGAAVVVPAVYARGRQLLKAEAAGQTDLIPDDWEPLAVGVADVLERIARALEAVETKAKSEGE